MKNFYILLVALFVVNGAMGQPKKPYVSCLPQGITFTTQAQIDNFQTNYPNCTQIEGDVTISGNNITNLNGLNVLTSIGGSLGIWNDNLLTNLSGLNSLSAIGGNFIVQNNPSLLELTGLNNLHSIGGIVMIISNTVLTNLDGMNQLTSIVGSLIIFGNTALTSLMGINNIDAGSIADLDIRANTSLSICAVQSICNYLASPNGTIKIESNATGCNSIAEVDSACVHLSTNEILNGNSLSVYPNPTATTITIQTPTDGLLSIFNTSGQQFLHQEITERNTTIDVSNLPTAVYFVWVTGDKNVCIGKFIKQ